jgi:hypothetical protein
MTICRQKYDIEYYRQEKFIEIAEKHEVLRTELTYFLSARASPLACAPICFANRHARLPLKPKNQNPETQTQFAPAAIPRWRTSFAKYARR